MRLSRKIRTQLVVALATCLAPASIDARPVVGLTASNQLVHFDHNTPATITLTVPITGLVGSDSIHAIDFRPSTGVLYGLGITTSDGSDEARLYTIHPTTGQATAVGAGPFFLSFSANGAYGFDFDPVADLIRVVSSSDQNLRVAANSGTLLASDTSLNPAAAAVVAGLAYDRNDKNPGTAETTLFGIDFGTSRLVRIGGVNGAPSPNGGVVTTVGSLGFNLANANVGFDIDDTGLAWASMATGAPATYRLYLVSLANGQPQTIGTIGDGATVIRDIALAPKPIRNTNTFEVFDSISIAVADSDTVSGHTITVSPGVYDDFVTVNKRLTFLGSQAGVDGRSPNRTNETVVQGPLINGKRSAVFNLATTGVTIDGFTITGTTSDGAAIVVAPGTSGANIRNNIITNNRGGIYLANLDFKNPALIERNRFANNNNPDPNAPAGVGIFSDQNVAGGPLRNVVINENIFTGHNTAAVYLSSDQADAVSRLVISNNSMTGNGIGVFLSNTTSSTITRNTISGSNPAGGASGGVHIRLGGGVNAITIEQNVIEQAGQHGILFAASNNAPNTNVAINCNVFADNELSALFISNGEFSGPLDARGNWWDSGNGPTIASNPKGSGETIGDPAGQVDYSGFLDTRRDLSAEPGFQCDPDATLYGVDSANNLLRFRSSSLGGLSKPITGLQAGETIRGIDFRPTTGELFAIGNTGNTHRLYVIDPLTGAATLRAQLSNVVLGGTGLGMAFDPVEDLTKDTSLRVVTNTDQNVRINVVTGGVFSDTPINPPLINLDAIAYSNRDLDPQTGTTLIGYDFTNDRLVKTGAPNSGTFVSSGPSGYSAANEVNMDVQTTNGRNVTYVSLQKTAGETHLYLMDTFSGLLTPVGEIGSNKNLSGGMAVAPAGVVQFSAPSFSANETDGTVAVTLTRTGGSAGFAGVNVATFPGTAKPADDYKSVVFAVLLNPGETSKTVNFAIVNDALDEPNETFDVLIGFATSGVTIGEPSTAVVTIIGKPTPALNAGVSQGVTAGGQLTATATLAGGSNVTGTVTFAIYDPSDSACAGAPVFTSTVPVNGDGTYTSPAFPASRTGTYKVVATYSGDPANNSIATLCGDPTATVEVTPATVLGNIATRLRVENDDNVLIGGIIVTGTHPKRMMLRAIGPSSGVAGSLGDPYLELYAGPDLVAENNNWREAPNQQEIIDSTISPSDDRESAILITLNPGQYTAVMSGVNGETGVGVVEAYDLDRTVDTKFANIATRGLVQTNEDVMIGGLIILGDSVQNVLLRAIGPSLPVDGRLADPTLELVDANGDAIATNNNWRDDQQVDIEATGIPPADDLESAVLATLPPAPYTAVVRGVNGGTGVALVEVYALQ